MPPIPPVPGPPIWQVIPSLLHLFDGQGISIVSVHPPASSQTGVTRLSTSRGHVVIPQGVPAIWLPFSTHWDTPVEHDVTPILHLFASMQDWFGVQAPHAPEWQTFPEPHVLPSVA
jgi:hypothetical protein